MAVVQVIPEGDLELVNGNFVMIDGSAMVRQSILSRFRFFLGEWFLDLREGVPYFRDILVKNPDLGVVRSIFRRVLSETPGVLEIISFTLDSDRDNRTLSIAFKVRSTDGVIEAKPGDDTFIVRL